MPALQDQQSPEINTSIDVPSIVTSLNTNTGPEARPADFGPDMSGLAQGLDDAYENIYHAQREEQGKQMANDELWAAGQHALLDQKWTGTLRQAEATNQPIAPQDFQTQFQADQAAMLAKAPTKGAGAAFTRGALGLENDFFKETIESQVRQGMEQRATAVKAFTDSTLQKVNSGSMSADDALSAIGSIGKVASQTNTPAAASVVDQASAQAVQLGITNVAKQQGPGAASLALRGGYGGNYVPPVQRETLATTLDNQQTIQGQTRVAVAQQNVNGLAQKAQAGGSVAPADAFAAATELANAKNAQPVDTKPPSLTDFIQGRMDHYAELEGQVTDPTTAATQLEAMKTIESRELINLTTQRLNVMNPTDQRDQINDMADRFGADSPLVQHAAQIAQKNIERLTPGPTYDPAGVAMQNPTVQASMASAQQAAQNPIGDGTPQGRAAAQGQAQGMMKTAIESSFTAQRLLGVPAGQERVLTKQQAESYGQAADNPADAQKLVNNFQSQLGPDYAAKALQEVFTSKGKMSGSVSLALMNPDSQPLWAAAQFPAEKLKDTDPDATTIANELKANQGVFGSAVANFVGGKSSPSQAWSNYWISQKNDLSAASRRQGMEQAMPGMAQYFMKQNNMSAQAAIDHVIDLTIGSAYTTVPTGSGTSAGGQVSFPTKIAGNAQQASDLLTKANIGLNTLVRQHAIMDMGGPEDTEHLTMQAIQNGYWAYDNKTGSVTRMYDNALGPKVVRLGNGRPLMLDAQKLGATAVVNTPTDPRMQFPGQVVDAATFNAAKVSPGKQLGTDPNGLLVDPQPIPDNSPILSQPAKDIPIAPIANKMDLDNARASLDGQLPNSMKGLGPVFEKYGQQYGIDPKLLAAISMHETGRGTSEAFLKGNNAMGVSNSKGPISFSSAEESIQHQAHTLATSPFYARFRQTGKISDLGAQYAPIGAENDPRGLNSDWTSGVTSFYDNLSNG